MMPVWAVHISDTVLSPEWQVGGFLLAGLLALFGAWRIRDEEIPQTAVLASAFFVASLIHVKVPPTSVHLLLNGLVGVVLGRRAALAIPVGLFLQYLLIGHGGITTLGVNSCIMVVPALLAWVLFTALNRLPWQRWQLMRSGLVAGCAFVWTLSLVAGCALLITSRRHQEIDFSWLSQVVFHPLMLGVVLVYALLAVVIERQLENAPEFPLGLVVGAMTVLLTVALNTLVLVWGGQEDWRSLALVLFVAHLPIAVMEGIVVGFTVGFLARVKPAMLGWSPPPSPSGE